MQANPRNLDALFNSQLRYVVPMFQRLYVWGKDPQWATLWEDIVEKAELQLSGTRTNPHYLGALIVEGVRPNSPREVMRFLVIDGQQRMTTLQILLCAFRDIARVNGWKSMDRTLTRYVENADPDVMEHPEEELFKLWPTMLNRDVFRGVMTAGSEAAVSSKYPLVWIGRKRNPELRSPLVEAYLYFSQSIKAWLVKVAVERGKEQEGELVGKTNEDTQENIARATAALAKIGENAAFALLQALQQDFCVVEILLSEGDDSQEIFYSLNSQGRALSQSDLLRSLIFMRAEKEKVSRDALFAEYWSKFETPFWSEETKRGGRTYSRLDLGLRYFLMAKTGSMVDARRVNEEYRRWSLSQPPKYPSVKEELADFSRYGDEYLRYESAIPSKLHSADLRRVLKDFDVSTALPLVLFLEIDAKVDADQKAECFSILESFIARRVLMGSENKEYNIFFVEVIGAIRGKPPAEMAVALKAKLLTGGGSTRHWPTDEQLVNAAVARPIGKELGAPARRVILERLELSLRTKKSEAVDIEADLQIEHVMPAKWGDHWPLEGKKVPAGVVGFPYGAKDELEGMAATILKRNEALQTLGNLTLLNKYLNPAASNGSFDLKLNEYKHSVLRLNRYFDTKFGSGEPWDEEAIAQRGKSLGEALCKVWPRGSAS